jgi:hypothetical protein
MKIYIFLGILSLICESEALSQSVDSIFLRAEPRTKNNYDKPGQYQMIAQLDKEEINPGDSVNIHIKFSGYGEIGQSKVYFINGSHLIDTNYSYVVHSFNVRGNKVRWGGKRSNLKNTYAFTLNLLGVQYKDWTQATMFIDRDSTSNDFSILTETGGASSPIIIHLKTVDNLDPGSYKLTIVFTYFNGEEWQGQSQVVELKVKNWVDRNTTVITILGLTLAFISVVPFLVEQFMKIVSFIRHL